MKRVKSQCTVILSLCNRAFQYYFLSLFSERCRPKCCAGQVTLPMDSFTASFRFCSSVSVRENIPFTVGKRNVPVFLTMCAVPSKPKHLFSGLFVCTGQSQILCLVFGH